MHESGEEMDHQPKIIIVEDEPLIVMAMEDLLVGLGFEVGGCAYTEVQGFDLIARTDAAVALLDVHLGDSTSFALASACTAKGISVIFTTGDDGAWMTSLRKQSPVLGKPLSRDALVSALRAVGFAPEKAPDGREDRPRFAIERSGTL